MTESFAARAERLGALVCLVGACALAGCDAAQEPSNAADRTFRTSSFRAIETDFAHRWAGRDTHILSAAAVLDVDGDGTLEVFVGGGEGQDDQLLHYVDGRMAARADGRRLSSPSATYAATASDLDLDGRPDLLVSRRNGVTLYLNRTPPGGAARFVLRLVRMEGMAPQAVALGVAPADYDRDGDIDLYVSVFVAAEHFRSVTYNDADHAKKNILLRNEGDLRFVDVTQDADAAATQNTFGALWVDLDQDRWLDLLLAPNTEQVQILHNQGNGGFRLITLPTGYGFWMSATVGDLDADSDADLFLSNSGISMPDWILRGDLREGQTFRGNWALLRNDGGMEFADVSRAYGVYEYGFGWGGVMEDINLDGRLDLLVGQNYIKWPLHHLWKLPGKTLLNLESYMPPLRQVDMLGLDNRYFGQAPLVMDMNGDGRQDILWLNMDGPLRAFLNRSRENFVMVRLPDRADLVGTQVTLVFEDGRSPTHFVGNNVGIGTDQTSDIAFGLAGRDRVEQIVIDWPNGRRKIISDPPINQRIDVAAFMR